MLESVKKILNCRCPNCGKGNVFGKKQFFLSVKFSKMNESCSNCNKNFQKEPGFFIGAMYVSYALIIVEMFSVYLLLTPFFDKALDLNMLPILTLTAVLLVFFNIRYSRMIWMYLFKN
tara:strand:+ start:16058 stop:16411 length:354 start_codon:yes stop_codon:yes gene_type:complete